MASESPMPPVNGNYGAPHYNAAELPAHNPTGAPNGAGSPAAAVTAAPQANASVQGEAQESGPSKDEVGWYFVEQYYTTLSKNPEKLPLFYNKKSQLVFGNEADRAPVSVGQRAIGERIKEIGVEDCKVRVTNVDSQESQDKSIVIQVIGEMSNRNEPHRKYVQTFVLAKQQNGYYVLNDIFRYIAEDDDDDEAVEPQAEPVAAPAASTETESKTLPSSDDVTEQNKVAEVVNQKLESISSEPSATVAANGASTTEEPETEEDAPTESVAESVTQETVDAVEPEVIEPEVPKDPEPTPAAPSPAPEESEPVTIKESGGVPKSSAPKTWASMFTGGTKVVTPAVPTIPAAATPQPKKAASPAAPAPIQQAVDPTLSIEDQALPSPGGWQTAGQDHSRKQNRGPSGSISANTSREGVIKAYIKNVTEKVDGVVLKATLAKYGKLEYFDVSRQKNCAFVEFADQAGFNAAAAANPHNINGEDVYVEERHVRAQNTYGFNNRGSIRGRGGMDARNNSQGGRGGFNKEGARGNFQARGGRGGSISRGRGMPAAA